jgi:sugar phosphate isomerase/epimerase
VQEPAPSFGGQINYEAFLDELVKVSYDGYLVSEYCLPVLKDHSLGGIEEVDLGTRLALRYMREIVERSTHAIARASAKASVT